MDSQADTVNRHYSDDDVRHLGPDETKMSTLHKMRTAGSVSISPELFEKLYLNPKTPATGNLRRMIGNPTPVAITGFVMSLTPLSCCLMGWGGSGGSGAANICAYIFYGGILLLVGGFLELLLSNTFSAVVFMSFDFSGSLYLTIGGTLQPFYGTYAMYSPSPDDPFAGLTTEGFNASYAFFWVFFDLLCFFYVICSVRTNLVLVWILFTVDVGACLVTAAFFYKAAGSMDIALKCQIGGGAVLFAGCMGGWYLLLALLLPTVEFPLALPVGDLSRFVPSASQVNENKA